MISEADLFRLFCSSSTFSKPTLMIEPQRMISRMQKVGSTLGMSTFHMRWKMFAPSTMAASCSSGDTPERAAM